MTKYITILLFLSNLTLFVNGQDAQIKELSNAFIEHLIDKQYQKSMNLCTDRMQNSITSDELGQIWEGLEEQLGGFVDTGNIIIREYKGNSIIYTRMNYNKLPVYFQLTIDSNMQIAGFFYQLAQKTDDWKRPEYVDYNRLKTLKTTLITDGLEMKAELTLPKTIGPFPVVILVHGSGPNDMDGSVGPNKPLKDIAMGLSSNGYAVLRYDKRTFSHPAAVASGPIDINTIVLNDVNSAISLVKTFKEVDTNQIYIAGHSLGAMLAPKIAKENASVKGIIMLAAPARNMLEMIRIQLSASVIRNNQAGDTTANRDIGVILKKVIKLEMDLEQNVDQINDSTEILGVPASFWTSMHDYDQVEIAKELQIPICIVHGNKDQQVFKEDLKIWKSELGGLENASIYEYEELNHLLIPSVSDEPEKDYQNKSNVDKKVIEDLSNWLSEN